jgi:hypothetical protein
MKTVMVYPTTKNATNIRHPSNGVKLKEAGSEWPNDGFTARMISDQAATLDASQAYNEEAPAPALPSADPSPESPATPAA